MRFDTTRWSVVLAAGGDDSVEARAALATLCETYWYPIYAFVRRKGLTPQDAADMTQAFFASLLERRSFETVSPDRGRLRSFLLASLTHFMANAAARDRAHKRGRGVAPMSLSLEDAEGRYRHEPAEPTTPETLFERRWAQALIDAVLQDMRIEWAAAGREVEFEQLKSCLLGQSPVGGYAEVADILGVSEGAVKVAVHRLRRAFQARLHARIAATVERPEDVDEELRHLIRAVAT